MKILAVLAWLEALVSVASAAGTTTSSSSLYPTATRAAGAVVPGDGNYLFQGCYSDMGSSKLVGGALAPAPTTFNSVQECLYYCTVTVLAISLVKWTYVAVENSGTCYCGSTLNIISGNAQMLTGGVNDNTMCLPSCTGDSLQACGGPGYALLYQVRAATYSPTPSIYTTVQGNGRYTFQGCYTDMSSQLLENSGLITTNMLSPASVEYCLNLCNGYPFAGIENSNQCYCGYSLIGTSGGTYQSAMTSCNKPCLSNPYENCGGASGAMVYARASPTTPVPAVVSGDSNYALAGSTGCYPDVNKAFFGSQTVITWTVNSVEECLYDCKINNYLYAAVEAYKTCYCVGLSLSGLVLSLTSQLTDGSCFVNPCAGNPYEYCGAVSRLILYQNRGLTLSPSPPVATTVPGNGKYQVAGCYNDATNLLLITSQISTTSTTMSVEYCLTYCATQQAGGLAYNYAALQGGSTCLCGMGIDTSKGTLQYDYSLCVTPCSGSYYENCGGAAYNGIKYDTVYTLRSSPISPLPSTVPGDSNYFSAGCYSDSGTTHLLPVPWTPYTSGIEACLTQCYNSGSPFNYAGISYGASASGAYCFCGSSLNTATGNALQTDYSHCSNVCPGNPYEYCGGTNYVNVYQLKTFTPTPTFSSITSTSRSSSLSSTLATTTRSSSTLQTSLPTSSSGSSSMFVQYSTQTSTASSSTSSTSRSSSASSGVTQSSSVSTSPSSSPVTSTLSTQSNTFGTMIPTTGSIPNVLLSSSNTLVGISTQTALSLPQTGPSSASLPTPSITLNPSNLQTSSGFLTSATTSPIPPGNSLSTLAFLSSSFTGTLPANSAIILSSGSSLPVSSPSSYTSGTTQTSNAVAPSTASLITTQSISSQQSGFGTSSSASLGSTSANTGVSNLPSSSLQSGSQITPGSTVSSFYSSGNLPTGLPSSLGSGSSSQNINSLVPSSQLSSSQNTNNGAISPSSTYLPSLTINLQTNSLSMANLAPTNILSTGQSSSFVSPSANQISVSSNSVSTDTNLQGTSSQTINSPLQFPPSVTASQSTVSATSSLSAPTNSQSTFQSSNLPSGSTNSNNPISIQTPSMSTNQQTGSGNNISPTLTNILNSISQTITTGSSNLQITTQISPFFTNSQIGLSTITSGSSSNAESGTSQTINLPLSSSSNILLSGGTYSGILLSSSQQGSATSSLVQSVSLALSQSSNSQVVSSQSLAPFTISSMSGPVATTLSLSSMVTASPGLSLSFSLPTALPFSSGSLSLSSGSPATGQLASEGLNTASSLSPNTGITPLTLSQSSTPLSIQSQATGTSGSLPLPGISNLPISSVYTNEQPSTIPSTVSQPFNTQQPISQSSGSLGLQFSSGTGTSPIPQSAGLSLTINSVASVSPSISQLTGTLSSGSSSLALPQMTSSQSGLPTSSSTASGILSQPTTERSNVSSGSGISGGQVSGPSTSTLLSSSVQSNSSPITSLPTAPSYSSMSTSNSAQNSAELSLGSGFSGVITPSTFSNLPASNPSQTASANTLFSLASSQSGSSSSVPNFGLGTQTATPGTPGLSSLGTQSVNSALSLTALSLSTASLGIVTTNTGSGSANTISQSFSSTGPGLSNTFPSPTQPSFGISSSSQQSAPTSGTGLTTSFSLTSSVVSSISGSSASSIASYSTDLGFVSGGPTIIPPSYTSAAPQSTDTCAPDYNTIQNGDLESGTGEYWTFENSYPPTITSPGYESLYAVSMLVSGAGNLSQVINTCVNKPYLVNLEYKASTPGGTLTVLAEDINGNLYNVIGHVTDVPTIWTPLQGSFTPNMPQTNFVLSFFTPSSMKRAANPIEFYIDGMSAAFSDLNASSTGSSQTGSSTAFTSTSITSKVSLSSSVATGTSSLSSAVTGIQLPGSQISAALSGSVQSTLMSFSGSFSPIFGATQAQGFSSTSLANQIPVSIPTVTSQTSSLAGSSQSNTLSASQVSGSVAQAASLSNQESISGSTQTSLAYVTSGAILSISQGSISSSIGSGSQNAGATPLQSASSLNTNLVTPTVSGNSTNSLAATQTSGIVSSLAAGVSSSSGIVPLSQNSQSLIAGGSSFVPSSAGANSQSSAIQSGSSGSGASGTQTALIPSATLESTSSPSLGLAVATTSSGIINSQAPVSPTGISGTSQNTAFSGSSVTQTFATASTSTGRASSLLDISAANTIPLNSIGSGNTLTLASVSPSSLSNTAPYSSISGTNSFSGTLGAASSVIPSGNSVISAQILGSSLGSTSLLTPSINLISATSGSGNSNLFNPTGSVGTTLPTLPAISGTQASETVSSMYTGTNQNSATSGSNTNASSVIQTGSGSIGGGTQSISLAGASTQTSIPINTGSQSSGNETIFPTSALTNIFGGSTMFSILPTSSGTSANQNLLSSSFTSGIYPSTSLILSSSSNSTSSSSQSGSTPGTGFGAGTNTFSSNLGSIQNSLTGVSGSLSSLFNAISSGQTSQISTGAGMLSSQSTIPTPTFNASFGSSSPGATASAGTNSSNLLSSLSNLATSSIQGPNSIPSLASPLSSTFPNSLLSPLSTLLSPSIVPAPSSANNATRGISISTGAISLTSSGLLYPSNNISPLTYSGSYLTSSNLQNPIGSSTYTASPAPAPTASISSVVSTYNPSTTSVLSTYSSAASPESIISSSGAIINSTNSLTLPQPPPGPPTGPPPPSGSFERSGTFTPGTITRPPPTFSGSIPSQTSTFSASTSHHLVHHYQNSSLVGCYNYDTFENLFYAVQAIYYVTTVEQCITMCKATPPSLVAGISYNGTSDTAECVCALGLQPAAPDLTQPQGACNAVCPGSNEYCGGFNETVAPPPGAPLPDLPPPESPPSSVPLLDIPSSAITPDSLPRRFQKRDIIGPNFANVYQLPNVTTSALTLLTPQTTAYGFGTSSQNLIMPIITPILTNSLSNPLGIGSIIPGLSIASNPVSLSIPMSINPGLISITGGTGVLTNSPSTSLGIESLTPGLSINANSVSLSIPTSINLGSISTIGGTGILTNSLSSTLGIESLTSGLSISVNYVSPSIPTSTNPGFISTAGGTGILTNSPSIPTSINSGSIPTTGGTGILASSPPTPLGTESPTPGLSVTANSVYSSSAPNQTNPSLSSATGITGLISLTAQSLPSATNLFSFSPNPSTTFSTTLSAGPAVSSTSPLTQISPSLTSATESTGIATLTAQSSPSATNSISFSLNPSVAFPTTLSPPAPIPTTTLPPACTSSTTNIVLNGDFECDCASYWSYSGVPPSIASPGYNSNYAVAISGNAVIYEVVDTCPNTTYTVNLFYQNSGSSWGFAVGVYDMGNIQDVILVQGSYPSWTEFEGTFVAGAARTYFGLQFTMGNETRMGKRQGGGYAMVDDINAAVGNGMYCFFLCLGK